MPQLAMKMTMKKIKRAICLCVAMLMLCSVLPMAPLKVEAATKFNVSNASLKKALNNYSIRITIDQKEQRFVVRTKEITKFTVKSKKYSKDRKKMTVTAAVYINRKIATVKTTATMKYSLKKNKWKLSSVKFGRASLSSVSLKGTWTGTYVAGQGETRAKFVINRVSKDGYATGKFYFSATPTNPKVPSGSYTVVGGYDKKTGKVTLAGDEWITRPSGYDMVDFYCYLDIRNKKIKSYSNSLVLTKK